MEFRILGSLEVVRDGRVIHLGSGRQLALVAVLLMHANEAVSVDRLVDELWGESPPATAAKIVRNSVSLLRRQLGTGSSPSRPAISCVSRRVSSTASGWSARWRAATSSA